MRAPRPQANGYYWDLPDREWLECQYVELKKSLVEIANKVGASPSTVKYWLQKLGIRLRTKKEDSQLRAGKYHYKWQGGFSDDYCSKQAHEVLRRAGIFEVCELCGSDQFVVAHHLNQRTTNNALENICYLCRSCHRFAHERKGFLTPERLAATRKEV